jgi:hypothetical protein
MAATLAAGWGSGQPVAGQVSLAPRLRCSVKGSGPSSQPSGQRRSRRLRASRALGEAHWPKSYSSGEETPIVDGGAGRPGWCRLAFSDPAEIGGGWLTHGRDFIPAISRSHGCVHALWLHDDGRYCERREFIASAINGSSPPDDPRCDDFPNELPQAGLDLRRVRDDKLEWRKLLHACSAYGMHDIGLARSY